MKKAIFNEILQKLTPLRGRNPPSIGILITETACISDFVPPCCANCSQSKIGEGIVNTDDIWEVRVQFGGNIFRLLGFFDGHELLVLTGGFVKKTQKTPRREISPAERRKRDYFNRR